MADRSSSGKGKKRSTRDRCASDTEELRIPPQYRPPAGGSADIPPARNMVRQFREEMPPQMDESLYREQRELEEQRYRDARRYRREQRIRESAAREMRPDYPDPRSHYTTPRPKRRRSRPRRSGGFLGSLVRFVAAVAVAMFVLYSVGALLVISRLDRVPEGQRTVHSGTLQKRHVRTVLLIGTDARDPASEWGRSDSMVLLTLNSHTHEVGLNSLMRDAYVQIPGYGSDRLNAAYSYGGPELLLDTVEQNFNVSVDDYVCVSFQGFAGVIDAVGGVELTIFDEEADAINRILQSEVNAIMGDAETSDLLPSGGTFILDGKQALSYSRIRYVGNADFERTERQRDVLEQIGESARRELISAVPRLLKSSVPHISTNMTTGELYLLSLRMPFLLLYHTQQRQIPADGTWSADTVNGQSVLRVDLNANEQVLREGAYAD